MAMALVDPAAVDLCGQRTGFDRAGLRTEPHRAAHVGFAGTMLDTAGTIQPFGDQRDHRVRRVGIEFRAVGTRETRHVAREFDGGKLHAEADAEIGNPVLARMTDRRDLALDTALAETARY